MSSRVKGLYYAAGASMAGTGIPMALIGAEVLLKRIRGDRSDGPLDAPIRSSIAATALLADRVDRANAAMAASHAAAVAARSARAASAMARTAAAGRTLSRSGESVAAGGRKALTSARGFAANSNARVSTAAAHARTVAAAARARLDEARAGRSPAGRNPAGSADEGLTTTEPADAQSANRSSDPEPVGTETPGKQPDPPVGSPRPYWLDPKYDPESLRKEK